MNILKASVVEWIPVSFSAHAASSLFLCFPVIFEYQTEKETLAVNCVEWWRRKCDERSTAAPTTIILNCVYVPEIVVMLSLNISASGSLFHSFGFWDTVCLVHLITAIWHRLKNRRTNEKLGSRKISLDWCVLRRGIYSNDCQPSRCAMMNQHSRLGMLNHFVVFFVVGISVVVDVVDWQCCFWMTIDIFFMRSDIDTMIFGNLVGSLR